MRSVKAVIDAALVESGIEDHDRVANRICRRLGAHRTTVIAWLIRIGAIKSVGYTSRSAPRVIRPAPITHEDCPVYVNAGDLAVDGERPKAVRR